MGRPDFFRVRAPRPGEPFKEAEGDRQLPDDMTAYLTDGELRAALEALSEVDLIRLKKAATRLAGGTSFAPDDLIHEAVRAVLEGRRNCPAGVCFATFLASAMRSIVSAARKAAKIDPLARPEPGDDEDGDGAHMIPDSARTPEETVIAADEHQKRLAALDDLFADDDQAMFVLMGDLDGVPPEEVREMGGLDETSWNTVRRRIRRKIEKAYPEGWRP